MALAQELAGKIARNAPLSNYFMVQAISRIEDMSKGDGMFTESLCAALSQTTPDAQEGLQAFLEKRAPKFR
jgi:enoyl-CoA hydratase/carnithine racemase